MDSLSRINDGITSIEQLQELVIAVGLHSLCLHGNNISRISSLQHLTGLQELNLSSNAITVIEGLEHLTRLTSLNLATNKLRAVGPGLAGLLSLERLNLSYNSISDISGLASLQGPTYKISHINLQGNLLSSVKQLTVLCGCPQLSSLLLSGNPMCSSASCASDIRAMLPQVQHTDLASASPTFQPPAPLGFSHMLHPQAPQFPFPYMQHSMQHTQQAVYPWQQQAPHSYYSHLSEPGNRPPKSQAGSRRPKHQQPQQQHAPSKPAAAEPISDDEDSQPAQDQPRGSARAATQPGMPPSSASPPRCTSAATQTPDGASEAHALQAEAASLRQQLASLTQQLEGERAAASAGLQQLELRLRQELDEAQQREQLAASQQVEESYQEASYAVSRAL
jgi:hypothetical protein